MKTLSGIMSNESKTQYLESCRARYPNRNRKGKSAMIDEVCDTLGWERKHTIKALNGKVHKGQKAQKRGIALTYGEAEKQVIITIWKLSEQPCGKRLKPTIPLWIDSYQRHYGTLPQETLRKVLKCSPRHLDRITKPHRLSNPKRHGRSTGRTSHRLKTTIPVKCGPQSFDSPGWLEVDTVSHGGASSSGQFMWSLTLTDMYSGWTELSALWGNSGSEVCVGLRKVEQRMPFAMLGFDCDNGSEFLNTTIEDYLVSKSKKVEWTRSRPYKKNDQAHVEQKNFTHVRQLLGYDRYDEMELISLVNDLYATAWLPLRNYFTPVMKLVEKQRTGSKVFKRYDEAKTPCERILQCPAVSDALKNYLQQQRENYDPIELAESIERKLKHIYNVVDDKAKQRAEEDTWLAEDEYSPASRPAGASAVKGFATALVATAPFACAAPLPAENLANTTTKNHKSSKSRVS